MRRREVITFLGGVAIVWSRAVQAQQGQRVRRIGVLMGYAESDARSAVRFSLGHSSTAADVSALAAALPEAVERAKAAAAFP